MTHEPSRSARPSPSTAGAGEAVCACAPGSPRRHRRGRPREGRGRESGGGGPRAPEALSPGLFRPDAGQRAAGVLRALGAKRCLAALGGPGPGPGPRAPPPSERADERRWWAATVPSLRACAAPSSSATASTSTAKGGATPTSRTGCENVSGPARPRSSPPDPTPGGRPGRALRPGFRPCPRASILEATWAPSCRRQDGGTLDSREG